MLSLGFPSNPNWHQKKPHRHTQRFRGSSFKHVFLMWFVGGIKFLHFLFVYIYRHCFLSYDQTHGLKSDRFRSPLRHFNISHVYCFRFAGSSFTPLRTVIKSSSCCSSRWSAVEGVVASQNCFQPRSSYFTLTVLLHWPVILSLALAQSRLFPPSALNVIIFSSPLLVSLCVFPTGRVP